MSERTSIRIGDAAKLMGVEPATLRKWAVRHGLGFDGEDGYRYILLTELERRRDYSTHADALTQATSALLDHSATSTLYTHDQLQHARALDSLEIESLKREAQELRIRQLEEENVRFRRENASLKQRLVDSYQSQIDALRGDT